MDALFIIILPQSINSGEGRCFLSNDNTVCNCVVVSVLPFLYICGLAWRLFFSFVGVESIIKSWRTNDELHYVSSVAALVEILYLSALLLPPVCITMQSIHTTVWSWIVKLFNWSKVNKGWALWWCWIFGYSGCIHWLLRMFSKWMLKTRL